MKKNLIMGVVKDYSYRLLQNFINSLNFVGYDGDILFFVDHGTGKRTKKAVEKKGIHVIYFSDYPFFKSVEHLSGKFSPNITINNFRFLFYYNYLLEHPDEYENIMLTDVRDVIFQKDPFNFDIGENVCCFLESKTVLIKNDMLNSKWIKEAYGSKILDAIGDNVISCAGTIIGHHKALAIYLELFVQELNKITTLHWGIDQGIHNYLIYSKKLDRIKLFSNESGPVLTMYFERGFNFNKEKLLVNKSDQVVLVAHQYDKYAALRNHYVHKFQGGRVKSFVDKVLYKLFP